MTRPQTVQDVFDSLGRDRLVEPGRLRAFAERHAPTSVTAALERLVADGLLTAFQANEVAGGRGSALWLGGYKVLDRLGRGGTGSVFLAEHAVLGRKVAVKALSDALRADPGARRRFVREARAAAALDHPNIVRVFDVDMNHEPPYLVMEYVDGLSLQAAVARAGTFSAGEAAAVGVQVADGLARAAAVGLVHRDIKPANLLIDRRGAVKILDLGIVRFTHDDTHSRLHGQDVILGTLDYLAPEQAEDSSKVDARADIYALGATLYFLIAGHPPYPVPDVRQKLEAKKSQDPVPLHVLRPDVPTEFAAVVGRLMARDPARRYPSPATAVAALHPWATPGPDYPARLFRASSDSTDHGRRQTDHGPPTYDPLPDTLRIIKHPTKRALDAVPPPDPGAVEPAAPPVPTPETEDPAEDPFAELTARIALEPDTQGVGHGASATDDAIAVPPELMDLPPELGLTPDFSRAPGAATEPGPPAPACSAHAGHSARTLGLVLAALALLGGVVALVTFAAR
ncbi:MAG: protein kinase [Planctomycetes bacterium]|nr:protein kinase [Planctomycetota bacterium]